VVSISSSHANTYWEGQVRRLFDHALILAVSFPMIQGSILCAQAEELNHPVIKAMPGYTLKLRSSKKQDYSSLKLRIKETREQIEVKGVYWELRYEKLDENGAPIKGISGLEILDNYSAAVLEKGGSVLNRGGNYLHFSVPRSDGGTTYGSLQTAHSDYSLKLIDEAPLKRVLSFGAEELKKALDEEGHISVYGINFSVNQDVLQPGAEKIIVEIAKLMKSYSQLKLEIQGHTDNTGSADHNLDLSKRRAQTVKSFLLLYGIESASMVAKGYGASKPIATNDTEDGRAANRRVELVRIQ
jgi:outer membrane protein OmpA-like peptidoglycan-associated protein